MSVAPPVRRWSRWALYALAACALVMGLTVLTLRLLLVQVPGYRDDIRNWASEATGYDIRFRDLTASWPLTGPELRFTDVQLLRPGETRPVIVAREFAAGLSLWQLLRDWRPALGHVVVSGVELSVERSGANQFLVQGRTLDELIPQRSRDQRPELDLELEDITVRFLDRSRLPEPLTIGLRRLQADIGRDEITAELELTPPREYARRLHIEISGPLPLPEPLALPPRLEVRVEGQGVSLHRVLQYGWGSSGNLQSATGNLAVQLQLADGQVQEAGAAVDLREVGVETGVGISGYQQVAGRLDWTRSATGWDAVLSDLRLRRQDRNAPLTRAELHYTAATAAGGERWSGSSLFLRLDDVYPLLRAVAVGIDRDSGLPRSASGDVRDVEAVFAPTPAGPARYELRGSFSRFGVTLESGETAFSGLTGSVAADADGGRLQLNSRDVRLTLAQLFRDTLRAGQLRALLLWRSGPEGVRLISDDMELQSTAINIRSRIELVFPADQSSPVIDLKAAAEATEAREVLRYLPLRRFPPKVVSWLERAVVAGTVPKATVEFSGPLQRFPFAQGEGVFRVGLDLRGATLDYANGWPRIEQLDADVMFDGVGMSASARTAQLANLVVKDYTVRIPDLRKGVLAVSGAQRIGLEQILDFVRATPLMRTVGPTLERMSGSGPVDAAIRLALPIKQPADYDMRVLFDLRGNNFALAGVPLDLSKLAGRVSLQNTRFAARNLRAVMLGEPVRFSIAPQAATAPFSHIAEFTGSTPVPRLMSTFGLPLRNRFDGRVSWRAAVQIPAKRTNPAPLTVVVNSDLAGLVSKLPRPVAKAAPIRWPTTLKLEFPAERAIEVSGRSEAPLGWALRLERANDSWQVERGALVAGTAEARLPSRRGIEVSGQVAELPLGDWLDLGAGSTVPAIPGRRFEDQYRSFDLTVGQLTVAGQMFRDITARVDRGADAWTARVQGAASDGTVLVPFDISNRPLELDMQRLWLLESAPGDGAGRADPRRLPALQIRAADAALGRWRLGAVDLDVARAPDGLVMRRLQTRAPSFQIKGTGAWRVQGADITRQVTEMEASLASTDVQAALDQLGFDPVISGKRATVSAQLQWPGGPDGEFLTRASGKLGLAIKDGQIAELEPGSGRLLGLLSVTALPRRLALDFRDVFNKGLAFDSVQGDFRLGAGIAYTCNLGLAGPAADMGIVGRTDFGRRDYDQVAVVRPQVSNVLTVGGAVLGGPVGGVTMLLISQIFRKPLSTLGESYYRVSGDWDEPQVARIQRGDVDAAAFKDCERDVEKALRELAPPAALPAAETRP